MSWVPFDQALVDEISARMDLRAPNSAALSVLAKELEDGTGQELVCDLATGVGKTYLAAAVVEYVALQGVRNVLIVTPGKTIQQKTIANFTPGDCKYVSGAEHQPILITAEDFARGQVGDALADPSVLKLFVFNVQQLIRPTEKVSRRAREVDEVLGSGLYDHLRDCDDLLIIADEHHVYRSAAQAFASAVRELNPRALVGLTATPDEADYGKIVYRYTLGEAIADGLVKVPVIVYREDGIRDLATQLADACHLRARKEAVWQAWAERNGRGSTAPVLFVVCQTIADAEQVANTLAGDRYMPGEDQVLLITSQSSDDALRALSAVESSDSPVRAVVSVDKLKEGWDVKNIGVIVAFRALASQTLTEQILGRGLRLPFGQRVGIPAIDHVDLVAHDSYRSLLAAKDALLQRLLPPSVQKHEKRDTGQLGLLDDGSDSNDAVVGDIGEQGVLHFVAATRVVSGETIEGSELLQLSSIDAAEKQQDRDREAAYKILYKVDGAPSITFPRRERVVLPVQFSLSSIPNHDAQAVGAGFATEFPVQLSRKALMASRDAFGNVAVREERVQEETATQQFIPVPQVRSDLEDRIWGLGLVEQTMPELNAAARITREFLIGAGVGDDDDAALWSERRSQQATMAVGDLVRSNYNMRKLQPAYVFKTIGIPLRQTMPSDVGSRWESRFIKRRWYEGWDRSIQPVANFDAKSTEWALANIVDSSTSVDWWIRIYEPGEVWIERDNGRKYYPDFIVLDKDGVYWVLEGKSDRDARDIDVLDKKRAAEEWARYVRDDSRFGIWRYVFATESHIRQATSWEELLVRTRPER